MSELDPQLTAILTGEDMQSALLELANEIASRASDLADQSVGAQHKVKAEYGTDVTVGTDRARAHVWAKNGTAIHAERKIAPLMQIVANDGAGKGKGVDSDVTYRAGQISHKGTS